MAPSYKEHPIPELKGDPTGDDYETFLRPIKAMYDKWLTTVRKEALAALHPLDGLRELADIHSNFQREGAAVNASTAWQDNFLVMQRDIEPETQSIMDWINVIEKTVQGLLLARVSQEAINGAVCGNVIDLLTSFDDASNPTAALWLTRADTLCTCNDNMGECTSTEPPVSGRKRKAGAVKTGNTAAVYYTLANLVQAFFMGQQASGCSPP
eukprot:300756-Rhodomonas_salina.1